MKIRHQKIVSTTLSGLLLCLLFQNGSHVNWDEAQIKKVDLKSRNSHAQELLGPAYSQSSARLHEDNSQLSKMILNSLKQRLPKAYQPQAAALARTLIDESHGYGLDPVFVMALIATESSFNPLALGSVGEIGLMQIRPETAEWIAQKRGLPWMGAMALRNPLINVKIGVAYVAWLRSEMGPQSHKYVSAYNMGPNMVRKLLAQNVKPSEYRSRVIANYELFYKQLPKSRNVAQSASL